ncbi:MAG: DUF3703 domain-containing protein [Hydrogenovibrio crunogenus]|nr:DUF3703 domain-containing protein [Hydrogenovibrio crunogenus]
MAPSLLAWQAGTVREALRAAFEGEMSFAEDGLRSGDDAVAFRHYERAHVLGQMFVGPHVRANVGMLRVGWRRRDLREIVGQVLRIPGGLIGSAIGRVPIGNTGGANVSAFEPMAIPADLAESLADDDGPAS